MSKTIIYEVGNRPNWDMRFFSARPNVIDYKETPPSDPAYIHAICLDFLRTEHAWDMHLDEVDTRWELLCPGRERPGGMGIIAPVLYAEAIWVDTIWHNCRAHANVLQAMWDYMVPHAVDQAVGRLDDWVSTSGRPLDFSILQEIAVEGGVEYRVDAWLAGVPLELVLAE